MMRENYKYRIENYSAVVILGRKERTAATIRSNEIAGESQIRE